MSEVVAAITPQTGTAGSRAELFAGLGNAKLMLFISSSAYIANRPFEF